MDPKTAAQNLNDGGMSDQQIAQLVGSTQSTINRIRRGKNVLPDWQLGQGLIRLAEERKPRLKRNGT